MYLATCEGPEGAIQLAESQEHAARAASNYCRRPLEEIASNLLDLAAVRHLETSNKPLFDLLNIFTSGDLDAFDSFVERNGGADKAREY